MADCSKCGQPLKDGSSFCAECGAAVKRCPKCGQLLRDDSMFCGQCGAAVNKGPDSGALNSQLASYTYPVEAQRATTGKIRFTLPKPFFVKLGKFFPVVWFTNTILLDGYELRTVEMGEIIDLEVPIGQHTMQLVHAHRSITTLGITISRKSNLLELTISAEMLPAVSGVYDYLWQKFDLSLQGYFPLR